MKINVSFNFFFLIIKISEKQNGSLWMKVYEWVSIFLTSLWSYLALWIKEHPLDTWKFITLGMWEGDEWIR